MSDAVLQVGSFSSRCGACGRSADPSAATHDVLLGYGTDNGQPGCGATFTAVSSDYCDDRSIAATRRLRPDLPLLHDTTT